MNFSRASSSLGPWLWLLDESPERIGLIEEEWNHLDMLTEKTKLLQDAEVPTQPWKTGCAPITTDMRPTGPSGWRP